MLKTIVSAALFAAAGAAHAGPFIVSLESELPGIQNSTSGFSAVGVETFDARPQGGDQAFTTDFGGSIFRGSYNGVQVIPADQYGGAGGGGQYAVTFSSAGYTLDLSSTQPGGVTYFGFWLSALDGGNDLAFQSNGRTLFTFNSADARNFINSLPNASDYYGNPNAAFAGQNTGEPYAFLNFYASPGRSFDRILFSQRPGGGYESDNHTVGTYTSISGTIIPGAGVAGVPEPATWALMILGFGMVGMAVRRKPGIAAA